MSVGGKTVKARASSSPSTARPARSIVGELPLKKPEQPAAFNTLMGWCDKIRTLKVRTNADTPYDAENAIKIGAEGIGLCRTEHMFFDTEERRLAIQEMIVAETLERPQGRPGQAAALPARGLRAASSRR